MISPYQGHDDIMAIISPYLGQPLSASSSPRLPPWQAALALHALPHNWTVQRLLSSPGFAPNFLSSLKSPTCTSEVQSADWPTGFHCDQNSPPAPSSLGTAAAQVVSQGLVGAHLNYSTIAKTVGVYFCPCFVSYIIVGASL